MAVAAKRGDLAHPVRDLHAHLRPGRVPDASLAAASRTCCHRERRSMIDRHPPPARRPRPDHAPMSFLRIHATVLHGPLDPDLDAVRVELRPHRRRLWARRIVRRTWIALAVLVVAEAVLWTVARFVPLEMAPVIGATIPIVIALACWSPRSAVARRSAKRPWRSTRKPAWAIACRAPSNLRWHSRHPPGRSSLDPTIRRR